MRDTKPKPERKEMHYFTLTVGTTIYTCLSFDESTELKNRVGGKIEHQFYN